VKARIYLVAGNLNKSIQTQVVASKVVFEYSCQKLTIDVEGMKHSSSVCVSTSSLPPTNS
jgi:hypothetical protein